jgi:hypothetical protein
MKRISLDDEIVEMAHPDDPELIVDLKIPDRVQAALYSDKFGKMKTVTISDPSDPTKPLLINGKPVTKEVFVQAPLSDMVEVLEKMTTRLRGAEFTKGGKAYEPKPSEIARIVSRKEFDYFRDEPVVLVEEPDTGRMLDPDSLALVPPAEVQKWRDEKGKERIVLWDVEAGKPVLRAKRHTFWESLIDRGIRADRFAEETEGKGSLTPSTKS